MDVREARPSDNNALLQLTEISPMEGVISLCIHRRPDFFALLEKRGESTVLVAIEKEQIVGVFSASRQTVWIDREEVPIYYIADLKVHPAYRGTRVALELAKAMYASLVRKGAKLVFCTMADGNFRVAPFFRGRAGLPAFQHVGQFQVLQLLSTPFKPKVTFPLTECFGKPKNLNLSLFYNNFLKEYQLGPFLHESDLEQGHHLMLVENGNIKAAISLMDTSHLKQNVVHGLPWYLSLAGSISRLLSPLLPVLPLPKIGEAIPMWNIRYFGYLPGHDKTLLSLVKQARKLAWEQKVLFLSIGLHERDAQLPLFQQLCHIAFTSHGMLATLDQEFTGLKQVVAGVPFEDFAVV